MLHNIYIIYNGARILSVFVEMFMYNCPPHVFPPPRIPSPRISPTTYSVTTYFLHHVSRSLPCDHDDDCDRRCGAIFPAFTRRTASTHMGGEKGFNYRREQSQARGLGGLTPPPQHEYVFVGRWCALSPLDPVLADTSWGCGDKPRPYL